jgi:hypothetical protein
MPEISPKSLRDAAGAIDEAANKLETEWDGLVDLVQGWGDTPWGGMIEDVGALIGESYMGAEGIAIDSFDSIIEGLRAQATRLYALADIHEGAESTSNDHVSSVEV